MLPEKTEYVNKFYSNVDRPYKLPRPDLHMCQCCGIVIKLHHHFFVDKHGYDREAWVTWCWICQNSLVVSITEDPLGLLRR